MPTYCLMERWRNAAMIEALDASNKKINVSSHCNFKTIKMKVEIEGCRHYGDG